jgi:DNA ligase D-like protein (predicted polymerase)
LSRSKLPRSKNPDAKRSVRTKTRSNRRTLAVPTGVNDAALEVDGHGVKLTNLDKIFWPKLKITKRDLLQYYADVSPWLLPHLRDRAMVMKRYPNGISGEFFFMKRAPDSRPPWVPTCTIEHHSGNKIDFPEVQNLATLLWVINLGCIDLNPWYARCDEVDCPDYLHFDLDPTPGASFALVRETALVVRDLLAEIEIVSYAKTTGSKTGMGFCEGALDRTGTEASETHHRRVPRGEEASRPRPGRLQPKCLEPDACLDLFRSSQAAGYRFDARHLAGNRARD